MNAKMIMTCAGIAACGSVSAAPQLQTASDSGVRPTPYRSASVDFINGEYVRTSEWVYHGQNDSVRGPAAVVAYDASGISQDDLDFDGLPDGPVGGDVCAAAVGGTASTRWFFGSTFSMQIINDDYDVSDGNFDSSSQVDGWNAACFLYHDGVNCERLITIFSLWDAIDCTGAGFDTDGDGNADSPYDNGTAGAGVFQGGVVTEWNSTACPDTDFDGVPDGVTSGAGAGYAVLDTGFNTGSGFIVNNLGIPMTDSDTGSIEFSFLRDQQDTDFDGIPDINVVSTAAAPMFWGTDEEQLSFDGVTLLCGSPGITGRAGLSSSCLWGEGSNGNNTGQTKSFFSWSDAITLDASSNSCIVTPGVVDGVYNPSIDFGPLAMEFNNGCALCPDPLSPALGFYASEGSAGPDCNGNGVADADDIAGGTSMDVNGDAIPDECAEGRNRACADVNANGNAMEPADFTQWLSEFNNPASPTHYRADVNNNGNAMEPADFTQWLGYFNNPALDPADCLD